MNQVNTVWSILDAFMEGVCTGEYSQPHEDKELRENLSEKQVDNMVQDSFPASDPPSTY